MHSYSCLDVADNIKDLIIKHWMHDLQAEKGGKCSSGLGKIVEFEMNCEGLEKSQNFSLYVSSDGNSEKRFAGILSPKVERDHTHLHIVPWVKLSHLMAEFYLWRQPNKEILILKLQHPLPQTPPLPTPCSFSYTTFAERVLILLFLQLEAALPWILLVNSMFPMRSIY